MTVPDDRQSGWRKSTYSASQGDCVEVDMPEPTNLTVGVRDSKDPDGGELRMRRDTWRALISSLKTRP